MELTYQWFKLYPHSKMVQNSLNILTSITKIVLYSYSSASLMIFIRSSKIVSYSSVVQLSNSTPFSASGFFVYQLKKQEIYDAIDKYSCNVTFFVVFLSFYKVVQILYQVE